MLHGELGGVDPAWRGWCLRGGELYGPDLAAGFKPGDVLAIPFVRAQLREHQREQRFPQQADAFSERFAPVPDAPPLPLRGGTVPALPVPWAAWMERPAPIRLAPPEAAQKHGGEQEQQRDARRLRRR